MKKQASTPGFRFESPNLPGSLSPKNRGKPGAHTGRGQFVVFLYAAYCKGYAKIGISEDPKTRVNNMQGGCPFPVELLVMYPLSPVDAVTAERAAQEMLDDVHWHNEWFKCSRAMALHAVYVAKTTIQETCSLPVKRVFLKLPKRGRPTFNIKTPDGCFDSAASAAAHYKKSRQRIHQLVQKGKNGWGYRKSGIYEPKEPTS